MRQSVKIEATVQGVLTMKRKGFTGAFKSKVAIAALKGDKTISELSSDFDVHATHISQWKKHLLEGSADILNGKKDKQQDAITAGRDALYAQISKLKVKVDWLKKKTGHLN